MFKLIQSLSSWVIYYIVMLKIDHVFIDHFVAQTALMVINLINLYIEMCGEYEMLNDAWKYNIE